nr:MAG TPA: hypothetical protein [Bacteriophage sp.]
MEEYGNNIQGACRQTVKDNDNGGNRRRVPQYAKVEARQH